MQQGADGLHGAGVDLGVALQSEASALMVVWRRQLFAGDARLASGRTALLEGVVEPLLVEIGRQLAAPAGSATGPWQRCPGLLRLSAERGAAGLDEEFDLFSQVLDAFAAEQGAPPAVHRKLRMQVEASRLMAHATLAHARDPAAPAPEAPFGGVVVELYEPPLRH